MTSKKPPISRQRRCRRAPSCGSAVSGPSSFRQPESVTDATDGMNELGSAIFVDLLTQPIDIHFHEVGLGIEVAVPDVLDDFTAGDRFGSMQEEQREQENFCGRDGVP